MVTLSTSTSTTSTTTTTTPLVMSAAIPVTLNPDRFQEALLGQQLHHRNRRLALEAQRRRLQTNNHNEDSSFYTHSHSYPHPSHWRRILQQGDDNDPIYQNSNETLMAAIDLSNCHLILWSGTVALGTPGQEFLVDFDTGSSDTWIPSGDCDDTCLAFPDWRFFEKRHSATFEIASDDNDENAFSMEYQDGERVTGTHGIDVLQIGNDIRIDNQVFAEATHFENYETCQAEEGVLGLAMRGRTSHNYPSVWSHLRNRLAHPVYSLYLGRHDDYPSTTSTTSSFMTADESNNLENGGEAPLSASSQIVLGGVDQRHYEGCLFWHDLGHNKDHVTGEEFVGYWDFELQHVKIGGSVVPSSSLALIDSGSSYMVGPPDAVGALATMNQASCFQLPEPAGSDPVPTDCADGTFDAALVDCEAPFFNVEFVANGQVYVMEKEDLTMRVAKDGEESCLLRVVGSEGMPGWVLGDVFLLKYYVAFDHQNQRVGLALATEDSQDRCEADLEMDVTYHQSINNVPSTTVPPVEAATESAVMAPTQPPKEESTVAPNQEEAPQPPYDTYLEPGPEDDYYYVRLTEVPDDTEDDPITRTVAPDDPFAGDSFDFEEVPHLPVALDIDQKPTGNNKTSSSSSKLTSIWSFLAVALMVGSIVAVTVAWRRRRQQQQRLFQNIISHAERGANVTQRSNLSLADPDGDESYVVQSNCGNRKYVMDVETLNRMG